MQDLVKPKRQFKVEIEVTSPAWRKPFVPIFEALFRAGDAVNIGRTTLYVKDENGSIIYQEFFGKSRKKAWYRQLEIEEKMEELPEQEFVEWLNTLKKDG